MVTAVNAAAATRTMVKALLENEIHLCAGACDAGAMEGRTSAANADRAATLEVSGALHARYTCFTV